MRRRGKVREFERGKVRGSRTPSRRLPTASRTISTWEGSRQPEPGQMWGDRMVRFTEGK